MIDSVCIVCNCMALACKKYRRLGHMFLKSKDLANIRVNSLVSLVTNRKLGVLLSPIQTVRRLQRKY